MAVEWLAGMERVESWRFIEDLDSQGFERFGRGDVEMEDII